FTHAARPRSRRVVKRALLDNGCAARGSCLPARLNASSRPERPVRLLALRPAPPAGGAPRDQTLGRQLRDEFSVVRAPASHPPPALLARRLAYCFPSLPFEALRNYIAYYLTEAGKSCQALFSQTMASSHCRTSRGGSSDLTLAPG